MAPNLCITAVTVVVAAVAHHAAAAPPPPLPQWEPTYNMSLSTAFMPCNYSGMFDAALAGRWGLADFDW